MADMSAPIPEDDLIPVDVQEHLEEYYTDLTQARRRISALEAQVQQLRNVLLGARHALRSYQYGNSATDLAQEAANALDAALAA